MKFIQLLLWPLSVVYGLIMWVRNCLFDYHIIRSESFERGVISVGNLSFGGTGKTPHVEYIIRLLKERFSIATLSRGYGRESDGFILGSKKSNVKYIGDEPLQYIKKFDKIKVAVDEERVRGINKLITKFPELDAVILDDAFQHRYVRPGLSVLLTDYHSLYTTDYVFPAGRLREFRSGARRSDIIIVSKTPKIFSPITKRRIIDDLKPARHQKVFFSYIKYKDPVPVYEPDQVFPSKVIYLVLFTCIPNDYPLREHLERICQNITIINFPDHHPYNTTDLENIKSKFCDLPSGKKVIVTTEKDMMHLKTGELSAIMKGIPLFYLPIEIDFHGNDREAFDRMILEFVETRTKDVVRGT
jgi:tetraacyldisaccharide 4'-kinase